MNWLKDIPFFRREFAKVWRNGYNHGFEDSDKISEWERDGALGYRRDPQEPRETRNPYGDI